MKRLGSMLILLAAAGCGDPPGSSGTGGAEAPSAPRVEVRLTTVAPADVTATLELVGNLIPRRRTLIVAEIDGMIESIAASPRRVEVESGGRRISRPMRLGMGEAVKRGDVLAQIVRTDYELALELAQAGLSRARADLAAILAWKRPQEIQGLEAAVREAAALLEKTRLDVGRMRQLKSSAAGSQSEVDRAQAGFLIAQAAHARAQAALALARAGPRETDLDVARAGIAAAEARVKVARQRLSKTTIRAPYDGVITEVKVDVGDRVTALPRIEIIELLDIAVLAAEVGVPERYTGTIGFGDRVAVLADGSTEPVPGLVVRVNEKVSPATRTFRVRCAIDNRARRFKAGQFARVRFRLASPKRQLTVPLEALTYQGGEPGVFVCDGGRVALRRVRTGLRDDRRIQVTQGLTAGQQVVTHDPALLADGMPVVVRATPTAPPR